MLRRTPQKDLSFVSNLLSRFIILFFYDVAIDKTGVIYVT